MSRLIRKSKVGFTLVEVVVSLAILIMLFALVFPIMTSNSKASNSTDIRSLCYYIHNSAAAVFRADPEAFIADDTSLTFLYEASMIDMSSPDEDTRLITVKYDRLLNAVASSEEDYEYALRISVTKSLSGGTTYRYDYDALISKDGISFYEYPEISTYKEL